MPVDEILRAYPEATVISESPLDKQVKPEFRGQSAKAEIKAFRIGDQDYRVLFFVKPSIGLHEVDIATYSETKLDDKATELRSLLTGKYGAPKSLEPRMNGEMRLMWNTPSYNVELSHNYFPLLRSYHLIVSYTRPSSDVLDKL